MRYLREEDTIILVRNAVIVELNNRLLLTHTNEGEDGKLDLKAVIETVQSTAKTAALETIYKSSHKFKTQVPTDTSLKNKLDQSSVDEA